MDGLQKVMGQMEQDQAMLEEGTSTARVLKVLQEGAPYVCCYNRIA